MVDPSGLHVEPASDGPEPKPVTVTAPGDDSTVTDDDSTDTTVKPDSAESHRNGV